MKPAARMGGRRAPPGGADHLGDTLGDPLDAVRDLAETGVRGGGGRMPHFDRIQAAFGAYDLGGIRAHQGAGARQSCEGMGAEAFATGADLAFGGRPSLFVAAHEAAHVVQQQRGVRVSGGVGEAGDSYERQADAVAERVVRGESAEPLLNQISGSTGGDLGGGIGSGVGAEAPVQMFNPFKGIQKAWNNYKQKKNQKKMDKQAGDLRDDRDRWLTEQRQDLTIEDAYEEGDLFYGLSRPREEVMGRVVPNLDEHLHSYDDNGVVAPQKTPMIADTLNNMFLGTGVEASDNNLYSKNAGSKEQRKQWTKEINTYKGEQENEIPAVKGYREFLEGHDRYDPRKVAEQEDWGTRVGRACKGGLEYTTKEQGKKVHFVLDGYDFSYFVDDLAKKGPDRAITTKELKWLFRNWDDPSVSANVIFWKGGKVVNPPWIDTPEPFLLYKQYLKNKVK